MTNATMIQCDNVWILFIILKMMIQTMYKFELRTQNSELFLT